MKSIISLFILGSIFLFVSDAYATGTLSFWNSKPNQLTRTGHYIFITSTTSQGDFGGIAGGNSICQTRATAAGLPGTWLAVLNSTASGSFNTRITLTHPLYNMAGQKLSDGAWSPLKDVPVKFNELAAVSSATWVRVGSTSASSNCSEYTTNGATSVTVGSPNGGIFSFMFGAASSNCSSFFPLYCVSDVITLSAPARAHLPNKHHTMFRTSNTYNGNLGGIAGADSICQTEAATLGYTGTYVAALSTSTQSVLARLTPIVTTGGVKNRQGFIISMNLAGLFLAYLPSSVETVQQDVWTGTTNAGGIGTGHCTSWTSSSSGVSGVVGTSAQYGSGFWTGSGLNTCDLAKRLYCISTTPLQNNHD